jgi:hypothetical protein
LVTVGGVVVDYDYVDAGSLLKFIQEAPCRRAAVQHGDTVDAGIGKQIEAALVRTETFGVALRNCDCRL